MPVMMYKGIPYGEGTNTLDGLKDVDISNPSTGDVVKYNSSTGKFENGQMLLSALSDIYLTNLQDGQIIKWDAISGKFVNADESGGSAETEIPGTLAAGESTITLQNAAITTDSKIDYYADVFGVHPINAAVTTGQIVLTYRPRATATGIKVVVS